MKNGAAILATVIGAAIVAACAGTVVAIADIPDQPSGAISDVAPISANAVGETPTPTPTATPPTKDDHPTAVVVKPAAPREVGDDKGKGGGTSGGGSDDGGGSNSHGGDDG